MTVCPGCERQVSAESKNCPHCGAEISSTVADGKIVSIVSRKSRTRGILSRLTLVLVLLALPGAFVAHFFAQAWEAVERSSCNCSLKQIGLALHVYHDAYGSFPPPYIADENGRPMHSWRVLILPHIDENPLYNAYDFTKPWDAPENRQVLEQMPMLFRCPSDEEAIDNTTNYVGVFGNGSVFDPTKPVRIRDVKDGISNTIMVGEVIDLNIPWTKPQDVDINQQPGINQPGGFGSRHEGGCYFLFADGQVQFIREMIELETLSNLFRRYDGNPVGDY